MSQIYEPLANLLEYPDEFWGLKLDMCQRRIERESLELARPFSKFYRNVEGRSVVEMQELYTTTFDLNPVCALEAGYHLFGEDYRRGIFLANLREAEAPYELGQARQLPDYLPVLLRLVVKLEEGELKSDLISECLIPAIEKMTESLDKAQSVYRELIATIGAALKREVPDRAARALRANLRRSAELPVLDMKGGCHA
jgi:nitrate reductase delta subunit